MDTLVVERSDPLTGSIGVSGAKNAALPIMAACLLTEEESVIEGAPRVTDVLTMAEILRTLGAEVSWPRPPSGLVIRPDDYSGWTAPYELVRLMRASVCVLGPLLAKHGRARVSLPGGCVIGPRPIDLHLKGLQALGAAIAIEHGDILAQAERLTGATIHLAGPSGSSVLATDNVMMAATLADGITVIESAACEPEVVDLANCLIAMGARISGHGTPRIQIEGVARLRGARWRVIPDRIETGTLMIAAAMTGGDVRIDGAVPEHLGALIDALRQARATVELLPGALRVAANGCLKGVEITTLPFPGFPTDLQAQMMALMAVSEGVSLVAEKIYPERFQHVPELRRMGASITRDGAHAIVKGVARLSGAPVKASDLRASAALLLAGLVADNHTVLEGLEHLDRGYERLEEKLSMLGARIHRERERS
ncbi:MAG: UDP-N-acetylglucosamine 1-carboxyvinyltransferase [Candidatus Omnitrophica bacterium]|nr:UDP-N-acetylglucosamine 1-carboxyvinyltransferase [Candidatus Omnitrophota bacterium]